MFKKFTKLFYFQLTNKKKAREQPAALKPRVCVGFSFDRIGEKLCRARPRRRAHRLPAQTEMSAAGPAPPSTFDYYNVTTTSTSSHKAELNVPYALCEILVAVCAVVGNGLVILVFAKERKLRRRTNYYIISLATADLLVGLFAIPFAILASIGLPTNLHACLFTVSVLVVLCTISIFCLVAVSIDRYWAILHPMGYSRTVRTKTAIG